MIAVAAVVWCHDDRRVNKGVSPSRGVSGPAALKTTVIFRKRLIGHSPVTGPVRIVIYVRGCLIASKYTPAQYMYRCLGLRLRGIGNQLLLAATCVACRKAVF